jgi:exonuclease SbcD
VLANSERLVHLGEEWAATPQALPDRAQYVALGHIHRPQRVEAAPAPAEYSGSLLQLDFGEAGQQKSFVVVDVKPGLPARVHRVHHEGGKPLADLRLTLAELEAREQELRNAGWLRLTIPLGEPDLDLARKVRQRLPNALVIRPELPTRQETPPACRAGKSPVEMYRDYHAREHGRPPAPCVEEAFQTLYARCGG